MTNKKAFQDMFFIEKRLLALTRKSKLAKLFYDPVDRSEPVHLSDKAFMAELLSIVKSNFKQSILEADKYAQENGALFVHFLQPHLYADEHLTPYESKLAKNI